MDLRSFLAAYEYDTDNQLISLTFDADADCELKLVFNCYPWWLPRSQREDARGRLSLYLRGILESKVDFNEWFSGHIDDWSVSVDDPLLWEYGRLADIFGTAPLPEPDRFLSEFHDLVSRELGVRREPFRYLCGYYREWLDIVSSHSYCLLSAPEPIATGARTLLDAQGARYNFLPGPERGDPETPLVVYLGSTWVICESANVETTLDPTA